jgi:hypothetical protein
VRAVPELLGAPTIGGGECPAWGWGWSDSLKSYKPSQPYEIAKNGEKMGGFTHIFDYKSLKKRRFSLQST